MAFTHQEAGGGVGEEMAGQVGGQPQKPHPQRAMTQGPQEQTRTFLSLCQ